MGEPPIVFQVHIRPGPQFGERVLAEEFRRRCLRGDFPGGRLGTIFAKLKRMGRCRLCPRTADAHDAVGLVLFQQDFAAEEGDLFLR
jgi:hypothetical protein